LGGVGKTFSGNRQMFTNADTTDGSLPPAPWWKRCVLSRFAVAAAIGGLGGVLAIAVPSGAADQGEQRTTSYEGLAVTAVAFSPDGTRGLSASE
jgi:hypothetical protein